MESIEKVMEQLTTHSEHTEVKQSCDISDEEKKEREKTERECSVFNDLEGSLSGYNCPKCKNKGVIYKPRFNDYHKYWYPTSIDCDCKKIRAEINRREKSGLNKLVQKYTFDSYNATQEWQKTVAKKACDYVRNIRGWFFIGGQVGSGKTHICTAIVNALISKGRAARYMIWNEEITNLKQAATDGEKYEGLIRSIQRADILYIDDFFKVAKGYGVTASDINTTFKIINYRYNEDLPTIISSELSISEIIKIDEALGSRIAEMAHGRDNYIAKDENKNYRYRAARS